MACSPEVLTEVVLGVGGICYEQREDTRPADLYRGDYDQYDACYQARLWTHLSPISPYLPLFLRLGTPGKATIHEVDTDASCRGDCSCSTTSSLTCSLPTSSSPMLRRSILPLLIANARIARAPMASAPKAPAPTARAPSAQAPLTTRPIATRSKAACLPGAEWFFPFTVRFLTILLPCPSSPWSCVPPNLAPKGRLLRSRRRQGRVLPSRCPSPRAASKTTIPHLRVRS